MSNWTLTRNDDHTSINLHPQFMWSDEYDYTPIAQSDPTIMLSGAIDIQQSTLLAGRPITLDGTHVWLHRAEIKALQTLASVAELSFTLAHPDGRAFNVMFKRPFIDNITAIKPMRPSDEDANDHFTANLYFMTV